MINLFLCLVYSLQSGRGTMIVNNPIDLILHSFGFVKESAPFKIYVCNLMEKYEVEIFHAVLSGTCQVTRSTIKLKRSSVFAELISISNAQLCVAQTPELKLEKLCFFYLNTIMTTIRKNIINNAMWSNHGSSEDLSPFLF